MADDQFDKRFRMQPRFAGNPGARKRSRYATARQKELQGQIRFRPANIDYFQARVEDPAIPEGARVVGTLCNMVPPEIVLALGAVPARLGCGNPALVQSGEEVLSGEICPLAKSSFASFLDEEQLANRVDCLVVPTTCDAKRKLGEILADYRPVFMLNLPPEQDYSRYWKSAVRELERLIDFLRERVGRKLKTADLSRAIELGLRRTRLVRDLQEIRAAKPEALSIRDFHLVIQASNATADLEGWLDEAETLLAEVRAYEPVRERIRPRLILTGAPAIWPNFKPLNLIEECGADVVGDTLCTGGQAFFDAAVPDERSRSALLRALVQRDIFGSACPCFISSATRLSRVLDLVGQNRADGVVHYGLRLCQLFDMEVYRLSAALKERGIPFMNMRTDYSLEDTEQLRVRLEAFLETIEEE